MSEFRAVVPLARVPGSPDEGGYFYAGEAARILDLDLDYRQLRSLFQLAREQRGSQSHDQDRGRWSRFTLEDLTCVEVLIRLCGGREVLEAKRRMHLKPIREACLYLRTLGFENPLLEVEMEVQGRRVFVRHAGVIIEPSTGQLLLDATLRRVTSHVEQTGSGAQLLAALKEERQRTRPDKTTTEAGPQNIKGQPVQIRPEGPIGDRTVPDTR